ncbi:MAG TPA: trigger factor [Burkholderiales bacterium]|nr:trigger factor [Burkholderiales bacterium]
MPDTNAIENLSQLERRLTMAVPVADIERQVDERLKKLARSVRMPGFRPGKVPLKIVAQQYGPQVRSEVTGDAVQKAFTDALRDQNLRIAGYPRIERKEGAPEGELQFSATFEVYPEVGVGDLAAVTIERPTLAVGDPEVDQTVEVLRKQRTRYDGVERAAAAGDRVTVDYTGTIDGAEFPGGKGADFAFVLGEGRMLPEFEAGVTGRAAGDERTVAVTFPSDYQSKDVAGKTASFAIRLKKVEAARLPEVDAEFARSLGVADGDLAKMRAEVRANVEREVKKRLGSRLKAQVLQALVDTTRLELPKALVDLELERLVAGARADLQARGLKMENVPIDPQLFESQAKRRVALGLVVAELVKRFDLGAKPGEVRRLVEEHSESYEQPTEVVKWFYTQPERLAEFEGLAVEENVIDWVLKRARVVDQPVVFDQLMGGAG